ncbi:hypothetical protein AYK26_00900 [Euryarchaeota archaeon SM23-78]|nr:MAG: hypothetical protein AYK26_00900 [Euryarchaeota archaeon SM23-78]MBW3001165.1 hypothetical protein [Candidatus Woesearchaeota archaeon]
MANKQERTRLLSKLAHSVVDEVERTLGFKVKKLEKNLLLSGDPLQRKYKKFFRDLFDIPIPSKALLEISKSYVLQTINQDMSEFVNNTEYIKKVANDVLESFRYSFNAGQYSLGHILPYYAYKDIEDLLNIITNQNHQKALRMYYGLTEDGISYSTEYIAGEMNISKQRVNDIKNRALKKFRDSGLASLAEKYASIDSKANIKETVIIPRLDALIRKVEGHIGEIEKRLKEKPGPGPDGYLNEPINILQPYLSTPAFNALIRSGSHSSPKHRINTIKDLVAKSEKELRSTYKNIGLKKASEISDAVAKLGLTLGMEFEK